MRKTTLRIIVSSLIACVVIGITFSLVANRNHAQYKAVIMKNYITSRIFSLDSARSISAETKDDNLIYMLGNLNEMHYPRVSIDYVFFYDHISIALYKKETGNTINHSQILDFMSHRGRSKEIADYLEWTRNSTGAVSDYRTRLREIYFEYVAGNESFAAVFNSLLPLDMIDELIKKEVNPDYQMELTRIQNQYINDGYTNIIPGERTIYYSYPQ